MKHLILSILGMAVQAEWLPGPDGPYFHTHGPSTMDDYYGHGDHYMHDSPHRSGYQSHYNQASNRYTDPEIQSLKDELLMYQDPAAYKQRKLEKEYADEAEHIAAMKDEQGRLHFYEEKEHKAAEERMKFTQPLTYERQQEFKKEAERMQDYERMADPEYYELVKKVADARRDAHMTSLWQG